MQKCGITCTENASKGNTTSRKEIKHKIISNIIVCEKLKANTTNKGEKSMRKELSAKF